jgi:hypothetical protein
MRLKQTLHRYMVRHHAHRMIAGVNTSPGFPFGLEPLGLRWPREHCIAAADRKPVHDKAGVEPHHGYFRWRSGRGAIESC